MHLRQKGSSAPLLLLLIVVLGVIGGLGWYIYRVNSNQAGSDESISSKPAKSDNNLGLSTNSTEADSRLSSNWLLRKSADGSIRVPDGFNILVTPNDPLGFVLPDMPQGALKYEPGRQATIAGEPHKHFGLGLLVSFNNQGLNARGQTVREFKTYSGLSVKVDYYQRLEDQETDDFPIGAKYLKYTVTKDGKFFNIDYIYMDDGIVDVIDEMVKSVTIN